MTWYELLLITGVGALAGAVNTVAGGGSALTLPLLIVLGMPAHVANGTNRIGVAFQSLTAAVQFKREGVLDTGKATILLVPAAIGAAIGATLSTELDEDLFKKIIAVAMIAVAALVLFKKKKKVPTETDADPDLVNGAPEATAAPTPFWSTRPAQIVTFFAIGVYGGFLQAGVGIFLLAGLSLVGRLDLVRANAIKSVIVLGFTLVALTIFIYHGLIDWVAAIALSVGSVIGGYVGSKMTVSWGPTFVKWVVGVVVVVSSTRLLGLW